VLSLQISVGNETTLIFGENMFSVLVTEIRLLRQDVAVLHQDVAVLRQDVTGVKKGLDELGLSFERRVEKISDAIVEISDAIVLPSKRRSVEWRLPSIAAFLMVKYFEGEKAGHCSAVPVPFGIGLHLPGSPVPPLGTSTHFFTSAHCFYNESTWTLKGNRAELQHARGTSVHACNLSSRLHRPPGGFLDPLDLALVVCFPPVPMPPSSFSTLPFLSYNPVALGGYSPGSHVNPMYSLVLGTTPFALHMHPTNLVSSMTSPSEAAMGLGEWGASHGVDAAAGAVGGVDPEGGHAVAFDFGYVSFKPEAGLSGGAVLDFECGLLGIIEKRSFWAPSGRFVRLTPRTINQLKSTLCWGGGTEAC